MSVRYTSTMWQAPKIYKHSHIFCSRIAAHKWLMSFYDSFVVTILILYASHTSSLGGRLGHLIRRPHWMWFASSGRSAVQPLGLSMDRLDLIMRSWRLAATAGSAVMRRNSSPCKHRNENHTRDSGCHNPKGDKHAPITAASCTS